jgi:predicted enzyme related to lactoylglutathione lyase
MVHRSHYADGEPCWTDVTTSDVDRATAYYGEVLGWTFEHTGPDFGGYVNCLLDGRRVAGISPPGDEAIPPAWSVYFATHDLDAVATRIAPAGGTVLAGPLEVPANGRMLVGHDPTGAAFGLWEPGAHPGSQVYAEPGAMTWVELHTRAPQDADTFYRALFGYEQRQIGGPGFNYTSWSVDGEEPVCGRLEMDAAWEGIPPHWMPYFQVPDSDAATAQGLKTGGTLRMGPFDSPHGRVAVLADPDGAVFTVLAV